MNRGLWFVAGAGAGIYAMIRGRRAAETFTAEGLKDRAGAVGLGLRMFAEEVAAGKSEAEAELRPRLRAPAELAAGTTHYEPLPKPADTDPVIEHSEHHDEGERP